MTTSILSIRNLTKVFGGLVAIHDLSLEVADKAIHSVIGPNGAGKTTLFNCITGFYRPDQGEMEFRGLSLVRLLPDRIAHLGISRTYQNIRLFSNLTAIENILVGQHAHLHASMLASVLQTRSMREEERGALDEARRLLAYVGLKGKGDELSKNLPYGAQRRLEIGRALAAKPGLLLLDEPTAGMNPSETQDMVHFIRRLRDDLGITILLIEHQMRVVMSISERITVLDFGEEIAEGTPQEIQNDARVVEAYLGKGAASGLGKRAETAPA